MIYYGIQTKKTKELVLFYEKEWETYNDFGVDIFLTLSRGRPLLCTSREEVEKLMTQTFPRHDYIVQELLKRGELEIIEVNIGKISQKVS